MLATRFGRLRWSGRDQRRSLLFTIDLVGVDRRPQFGWRNPPVLVRVFRALDHAHVDIVFHDAVVCALGRGASEHVRVASPVVDERPTPLLAGCQTTRGAGGGE